MQGFGTFLVAEGLCDHDERGNRTTTEYFVKGTEPTDYCNIHQKVTYCKDTGKVATDECPNTTTKIQIYKDLSKVDLSNLYNTGCQIFLLIKDH